MNILVLAKRTFDTEEKITLEGGRIAEDGAEFIINPYDEYAVEEGIRLREEFGGEVTVLCVGPPEADKELRTALAMGADKAILVENDDLDEDEAVVAHVLAAVVKDMDYDILLGGNVSVDNGAGQVASRVAELLGIPQIQTILSLKVDANIATVERDVEGDVEIVETELPALFTAQQGLNDPRYPSLPNIMKAKKKPLERIDPTELGLDETVLSGKTEQISVSLPPEKSAGRLLEGEPGEQARELVHLLRAEAKVI